MLYIKIENGKITDIISTNKPTDDLIAVSDSFAGTVGDSIQAFDAGWNYLPLSQLVLKGLIEIDAHYKIENEQIIPKTLTDLVKDEIITVDNRHKIIDEQIVPKTLIELLEEGIEDVPRGMKLSSGELVQKTTSELVNDGTIVLEKNQKLIGEIIITKSQAEMVANGLEKLPDRLKLVYADDGTPQLEPMTIPELCISGFMTKDDAYKLLSAQVREEREHLFSITVDKVNPLRWEMLKESERDAWRMYRQALLDIPQQSGFPENVIWPIIPTC